MTDYRQRLREAVLDMNISSREKATALNILEQIFGDVDIDELVEQIGNGTVPETYIVKGDSK